MKECNIAIEAPVNFLKGAGLLNTLFLPAWIYNIKIILSNNSFQPKLCSLSSTLANGIRYMKNLKIDGPDKEIFDAIHIVEPTAEVRNNNVIVFANNITLSPNSINKITFDVALSDNYTKNSLENSGEKILHLNKLNFNAYMICNENVYSASFISEACDYDVCISCEDKIVSIGDTTKFYLQCRAGQYDAVRGVYFRSILDDGLQFVPDSSNLEPKNVLTTNDKTVIKWSIGSLLPTEVKRVGFKVTVNNQYIDNETINTGDILTNTINSNCINNSTYTQCPVSQKIDLVVE